MDAADTPEEGLVFDTPEEDEREELTLDKTKRRINTKSSDPEIESLYSKWKRGKLILQPDFQRQFVWDEKKASRLIESVIIAVPLPVIYLAEEEDGKESVIDGQQRLTSFFAYIDNAFPTKTGEFKPFKLNGLQVFTELNGKHFNELDEQVQDRIRYHEIRAITIKVDSDRELKFEIFERLNTGAVPLNDMELRNCVYRGRYMALLKELSEDKEFIQLLGIKQPDRRMKDVELVLRFAAFYHATYLKYQRPVRRFLNQDMEKFQNISRTDADELRRAFKTAVQINRSLFGQRAFKRLYRGDESNPSGCWEGRKFNASLYDVLMGVFCDKDKNQVYGALDCLREGLLDLISSNDEFVDATVLGTSDRERVLTRFELGFQRVRMILKEQPRQPRCFSRKLKEELYRADPTCAICEQRIEEIDDAAVDHIDQYWRGGKTIPEKARLTHRYCNMARSRND